MPSPPRFTLPPVLATRVEALRAAAPAGRPTRQAVVEAALAAGLGVLEGPGGADGSKGVERAADAPTGRRDGLVTGGADSRLAVWKAACAAFVDGLRMTTPTGERSVLHVLWGEPDTTGGIDLGLCNGEVIVWECARWTTPWSCEEEEAVIRACLEQAAAEEGLPCEACRVASAAARAEGRPTAAEAYRRALPSNAERVKAAKAWRAARPAFNAPKSAPAPADAPTGPPAPALARRVAPGWQPPPNDPRWALDGVGKPYARESHVVGAMAPGGRRVEVAVAAGDTVAVVRQAIAAAWQARGGAVG